MGTCATPGIICTNSYLSPHGAGVGNHWFQLHGINAHTVLGTDNPKTVRPQGRPLHCGVECTVKRYNKVLTKLLMRHRLFEKLEFLWTNHLMSADASNFDIPFLWEQDRTLMDAIHDTGIFDRREQETLNWYRHFKGVHSIGDKVCSNGHTIDPTMLTQEAGQSSRDFYL